MSELVNLLRLENKWIWWCETMDEAMEVKHCIKLKNLANEWTWGSRQWMDTGKLDNRLTQGWWTIDEVKKLGKMELVFKFWTFMDLYIVWFFQLFHLNPIFIHCPIFQKFQSILCKLTSEKVDHWKLEKMNKQWNYFQSCSFSPRMNPKSLDPISFIERNSILHSMQMS